MSNRDATFYIVDTLLAIHKVKRYVREFENVDALVHSELHWDATMRELQITGEAINALMKLGLLDSSYRKIVDFRNIITHAYFGIDRVVVWDIIQEKLPHLQTMLLELSLEHAFDLSEAIEDLIKEEQGNAHQDNVQYLMTLLSLPRQS